MGSLRQRWRHFTPISPSAAVDSRAEKSIAVSKRYQAIFSPASVMRIQTPREGGLRARLKRSLTPELGVIGCRTLVSHRVSRDGDVVAPATRLCLLQGFKDLSDKGLFASPHLEDVPQYTPGQGTFSLDLSAQVKIGEGNNLFQGSRGLSALK